MVQGNVWNYKMLKSRIPLFTRRYAIALLSMLWSNYKKGLEVNLDELYSDWQVMRPSRTTYSRLIREFSEFGVLSIKPGAKKSEKIIAITDEFANSSMLNSGATLDDFLVRMSDNVRAK